MNSISGKCGQAARDLLTSHEADDRALDNIEARNQDREVNRLV